MSTIKTMLTFALIMSMILMLQLLKIRWTMKQLAQNPPILSRRQFKRLSLLIKIVVHFSLRFYFSFEELFAQFG